MRICRITSAFVPPWRGLGPGPYELSTAQALAGHELTVITRYVPGCEYIDSKAVFKIYRIKTKCNLVFSFIAALKFLSLHIKKRFDVIHNHGESAIMLLFLKKLLFLKIPVVSSVHIVRKAQYKALEHARIRTQTEGRLGTELVEMPAARPNRKTLFYEKCYFELSDVLAAVNESLAEEIEGEYRITKNVSVIFNGVNAANFSSSNGSAAAEIKSSMNCEFLLLFVGALNGRKGEFDLINAKHKLVASNNRIKLLIVGDGPTKRTVVELVHHVRLQDNIKFITNMSHTELSKYYVASDLFILPSYSEGLSKVLLETMACGTAVIASDIPANKAVVKEGQTGYLFEAGNADSLASAISSALQSGERRDVLARNARALVERDFTWQAVVQRLDKIYDGLLNNRRN